MMGYDMAQFYQNIVLDPADRSMIDAEHLRLERFIQDLRETCQNFGANSNCYGCTRAQVATCQGRLASFFYDFLDLVTEHFENEETILRHQLPTIDEDQYFRLHQEAHERLIEEVKALMRESAVYSQQGNPSEAIHRLESKISVMFSHHASVFDDAFLGAHHH
jgi:hemerythrin